MILKKTKKISPKGIDFASNDAKYLCSFKTIKLNDQKFNSPAIHKLVQSFLKKYNELINDIIRKKVWG